ncbi:MAG: hypothetical protein JJ971_04370 [Balneolaceae bacterium]|nr:hypothetical protein [Balneolaceae bacterium]MBO6545609.1 hypothetical protein [Balneolaceae bacterium]MBO6647005.1 hypothetical protein [Balneolaceae bacterium]
MNQSKIQIPIKSGFILLGLFNLVIIGAGHGVATIGIMLLAVLFGFDSFDLSMLLLLLGWPGIFLFFYELRYARAKNQMLRSRVFFLFSGLLSVSIFGLLGISEIPKISFATAIPFFIGLLFYLSRLLVNGPEAYKSFNQISHKAQVKVLSVLMLLVLTTGIVLTIGVNSFKGDPGSVTDDEFFKQLIELDEFIMEERRIDSLKEAGMKVELTISVVKDSFFPEDSSKNLSVAFVEESIGFANSTLLIVKFDKAQKRIVYVEKN